MRGSALLLAGLALAAAAALAAWAQVLACRAALMGVALASLKVGGPGGCGGGEVGFELRLELKLANPSPRP